MAEVGRKQHPGESRRARDVAANGAQDGAPTNPRLDALLASVDVGLWYCDLPFDELQWDHKVKEHFWLPADARVTIDTFYERLHPDDRDRTRAAIERSIASRTPYDIEYRTVAPHDGQGASAGDGERWVRAIGYTGYGADGTPVRFDGVTVDITAQKRAAEALAESQARFGNMADHAPVMIWVTEPDGVCTYLNRQWYEFTGQTPATGLGLGWLNAVHPDDQAASAEIFLAANARHEPFRLDYRLRRADGAYRWAVDSATPRFGPGGEYLGYIGSVIEIHDRKEAESERARLLDAERAARAEAERASRAKGDFLAVMSHELRTPLNAIGGYAELLELGVRGPITEVQREDLARIRKSQRHLLALINEVLNYARVETGAVPYDLEDVEAREVVLSVEPLVAPQLAAKGLTFGVDACEAGAVARADREKVRQILLNLLSNAIKFTPAGGRVSVSCARAADAVTIAVRDTGLGVPPDKLEEIFDPFVQVNTSLTRPHEGTGLGLAISRDLARGMEGELTAESAVGVGSTFTLRLPGA